MHFSQQFFKTLSSSKLKFSSIDLNDTHATNISIGISLYMILIIGTFASEIGTICVISF